VLLQASCSNLPVTPNGVARMLAEEAGDEIAAGRAMARLEELSLMVRFPGGEGWVHRWTAQGLAAVSDVDHHRERMRRAGRYRVWRVKNESHALEDAIEAIRNFLAGQDFDSAAMTAKACFEVLRRTAQSVHIAAIGSEVLETLPDSHPFYGNIAEAEAAARLALGQTDRALARWGELLRRYERLAQAEPDRADYLRDLSVSYNKVGDLYLALGQGEQGRQYYLKDLAIAERLAQAEPNRADYQRDLSVSYNKVGDLYRALGQAEQARQSYLQALAIRERLAQAEPDRADYQYDLGASYTRLGDLYHDLGQGEQGRQYYLQSLAIAERLAQAEPDRAEYQCVLSVSYERVGDLCRTLDQREQARQSYLRALAIRERLAGAEPDRADYQRDLSVSYSKVGDLYRDLGRGEQARQYYLKDLAIAERLAQAEPERADYQRDLSVSLCRVGLLEESPAHLQRALDVLEALQSSGRMLATDEPILTQLREMVRGHSQTDQPGS
jgi:tetratricopeptide (TPR) repeat protein